jgi:hypothetical protein
MLRKYDEGVDAVHLVQDAVQLLIIVITIINFCAACKEGNSLPIYRTQNCNIHFSVSMFHLANYWTDFYKMLDWGALKIVINFRTTDLYLQ